MWSDAARKAALEARRRKRSAIANFHSGGTPEFQGHYTSPDYRQRLALQMKSARVQLRRSPDIHTRAKMNEVMEAAGRAQGHRMHWQNPNERRIGQGVYKTAVPKELSTQSLRSHPQYNKKDLNHLLKKGYTPSEIKQFWDRDHAQGKPPQTMSNMAPKRPKSADRALARLMKAHGR